VPERARRLDPLSPAAIGTVATVYYFASPLIAKKRDGIEPRKAIDDGYPQLRATTHGWWPGIIVLYDNVQLPRIHLDPYAIKTGMYGLEHVLIAPPASGAVRSRMVDIIFGSKKKVGPTRNRALSAVGHLYRDSSDWLGLHLYHNVYARAPLKTSRLRSSAVRHYRLTPKRSGLAQEWEPI